MELVKILNSDLILLQVKRYGDQLWSKTKLRKKAVCVDCRSAIKSAKAFRPLTNASNRADRLCLFCADLLRKNG